LEPKWFQNKDRGQFPAQIKTKILLRAG